MDPRPPSADSQPSRSGPGTGRTIAGKYRLGELLGKGGGGEVYRALQLDLDREVALKLLAGLDGDDVRARFLREARIAADVRHPCVAQVFDAGFDHDGRPFCVMELLEGETLAERLERQGPLDATEAVAIVANLCLALQAVHDRGFLHRDVKPANVFLARQPGGGVDPKLIDFGVAKRMAVPPETQRRISRMRGLGSPVTTELGVILGTPRYLSPEQVTGDALDARSDVHAVALTLYEMLSGQPAFDATEIGALLMTILAEPPESLQSRAPERHVPAALDRLILLALSKSPAERPPSAAAFGAALWTALAEDRLATPVATSRPAARGWSVVGFTAGAGAVILALAIAGLRRESAHVDRPALPVVAAAPAPPPEPPPTQPLPVDSGGSTIAATPRPKDPPMHLLRAAGSAPLRAAPTAARPRSDELMNPY